MQYALNGSDHIQWLLPFREHPFRPDKVNNPVLPFMTPAKITHGHFPYIVSTSGFFQWFCQCLFRSRFSDNLKSGAILYLCPGVTGLIFFTAIV
jgi:hypothetical protein